METITDDYGDAVYLDDSTGEVVTCEGCISAATSTNPMERGSCGDCYGGGDTDPYVNGNAEGYGWRRFTLDDDPCGGLEPWQRHMFQR